MDLINILFAKALNNGDTTKEYVDEAIKALKGEVSADLDTLEELSKALGNDPDFFLTIKNEIDGFKTELVTNKDAATENTRFAIGVAEQNLEVPSMEAFNQLEDRKLDNMPDTWPVWTTEQQAQARENISAADAKRVEAVETALAGKLSEPTEGLAVGKYFRVAAIDQNGHAVLEAVDAKDVGVQDVQVAGASVVADGVANVPVATINSVGVAQIEPNYGINIFNNKLTVQYMEPEHVDGRTGGNRPLCINTLDYAVKAAMCDGKGAAWTADEQAAARKRIGIPGDFELIEEIICDGNASAYTRSVEPDGIPYRFISVFIELEIQAGNTYPNIFFRAYDGNDNAVLYDGKQAQSKGYASYLVAGCDAYNGYYHGWMLNQNIAATSSGGSNLKYSNMPKLIETPIMRVYVNTSIAFNTGDKIRIYGVRA